jgi:hypothetical protein
MNSTIRILLAVLMGFGIGAVTPLVNGQDIRWALQAGLGFALLMGCIVAVLSWGMDIAVEKGYPGWVGFVIALVFNILGLVIMLLLPRRVATVHNTPPR